MSRVRIPSLAPTLTSLAFQHGFFLPPSGMSKAFTRASDDAPDLPLPVRPLSALPPGAKNYLTPVGVQHLREELERLAQGERPGLTGATDDADAKRALAALDWRIAQLEESLRTAVIVPPPEPPWDQVRFGATVTVRDRAGIEDRFRIVGLDETDLDRDGVSWIPPIAKALLNARIGQRVRFRVPAGEREVEI